MATEANHYTLDGFGIEGTVDTTSITGRPLVEVEVDGTALQGPELEQTALGLEVSGVLSAIPDDRSELLTLLLPRVNVDAPEVFSGVAIVTTALTTLAGPQLVSGPVHGYAVRAVAGTASVVQSIAGSGADC